MGLGLPKPIFHSNSSQWDRLDDGGCGDGHGRRRPHHLSSTSHRAVDSNLLPLQHRLRQHRRAAHLRHGPQLPLHNDANHRSREHNSGHRRNHHERCSDHRLSACGCEFGTEPTSPCLEWIVSNPSCGWLPDDPVVITARRPDAMALGGPSRTP